MKIGAVFPTTEIGEDLTAVRDLAQAAADFPGAKRAGLKTPRKHIAALETFMKAIG